MKNLEVGSVVASPGKREHGYINVGGFADGSPMGVPVILICGSIDGPTLWIHACEHGEENIGTVVIHRALDRIDPTKLRGNIIAIPALNIAAYPNRQRFSSRDVMNVGGNLWPGNPDGKYSEQLAYAVYNELVKHSDYMIDLHDGLPGLANVANWTVTIFDPSGDTGKQVREFTEAFGYTHMVERISKEPEDFTSSGAGGLHKLLNYKEQIPSFTAEIGHHEEVLIEKAVLGIINEFTYLKMIDGTVKLPDKRFRYSEYSKCYPKRGGVWYPKVKLEDEVKKGQLLAVIKDVFGKELERMYSPVNGVVLCMWVNNIIDSGQDQTFEIGRLPD